MCRWHLRLRPVLKTYRSQCFSDYPEACAVPGKQETRGDQFFSEAKRLWEIQRGANSLANCGALCMMAISSEEFPRTASCAHLTDASRCPKVEKSWQRHARSHIFPHRYTNVYLPRFESPDNAFSSQLPTDECQDAESTKCHSLGSLPTEWVRLKCSLRDNLLNRFQDNGNESFQRHQVRQR